MARIGYLRNKNSTRNIGKPALVPGNLAIVRETTTSDQTISALSGFRDAAVETIVVDGGDGTVCAVLTAARSIYGDEAPPMAIIASGNTNLIARKVGGWFGEDGMDHLNASTDNVTTSRIRSHPVMILSNLDNPETPPQLGFILGFGLYEAATRMARREIEARAGRQIVLAIASTIRALFIGAKVRALRSGVEARMTDGDDRIFDGPCLLGAVTVFDGALLPGLNPFRAGAPETLRWLAIDAPGRGLLRALPFLATGRSTNSMKARGYRSGGASRLDISVKSPLILDGESLPAGHYRVDIHTGARFIVPN